MALFFEAPVTHATFTDAERVVHQNLVALSVVTMYRMSHWQSARKAYEASSKLYAFAYDLRWCFDSPALMTPALRHTAVRAAFNSRAPTERDEAVAWRRPPLSARSEEIAALRANIVAWRTEYQRCMDALKAYVASP